MRIKGGCKIKIIIIKAIFNVMNQKKDFLKLKLN